MNFMWYLRRDFVKGQSGNQTDDTFRYPCCDDNEVRFTQRWQRGPSVEPPAHSFHQAFVSQPVEISRMDAGGKRFGSSQKPTVALEDSFRVVRRGVHVDKTITTCEKVE